jgi:hypothetical protein
LRKFSAGCANDVQGNCPSAPARAPRYRSIALNLKCFSIPAELAQLLNYRWRNHAGCDGDEGSTMGQAAKPLFWGDA